ncbi:MAG: ATP-binding cassette domain-containing protein [Longimicrobiales bacterium]
MTDATLRITAADVVYGRGARAIHALRGITASLEPGTIVGLIGVNGAGKTTLLELLAGAQVPTAGTVHWFGSSRPAAAVRARLGFCPDVPALPPTFTVQEALRFFGGLRGLYGPALDTALARSIERLELGPILHRSVRALSRGNLVRTGVAQALLGGPAALLLDESFAPLDPVLQVRLRDVLSAEARRGAAVLVSSHQLQQVATIADSIWVLHDGELIRVLRSGDWDRAATLEAILLEARRDAAGGARPPQP